MSDYTVKIDEKSEYDFFKLCLAYVGDDTKEKIQVKKLLSAMVIEFITRGDFTSEEKENIWDELIDLAIDYMSYCMRHLNDKKRTTQD